MYNPVLNMSTKYFSFFPFFMDWNFSPLFEVGERRFSKRGLKLGETDYARQAYNERIWTNVSCSVDWFDREKVKAASWAEVREKPGATGQEKVIVQMDSPKCWHWYQVKKPNIQPTTWRQWLEQSRTISTHLETLIQPMRGKCIL